MVGMQYLHTSLDSITNPEDPECESEGWLMEKSLKDTITSMLESIKELGKFNQVATATEEEKKQEGATVATVSWREATCSGTGTGIEASWSQKEMKLNTCWIQNRTHNSLHYVNYEACMVTTTYLYFVFKHNTSTVKFC